MKRRNLKFIFNNFILLPSIVQATKNSKIEASLVPGLPKAAQPIMTELSQLAAKVATLTAQGKVAQTLPIWNRGVVLIKQLVPALTDPLEKLVVQYLLSPWMNKFRTIIISGKGTDDTIDTYYTMKNAVLEALEELEKGQVTGK